MDYVKRVGNYFFILGVLLAIFSGGFPASEGMQEIKLLLLIITGVFVGLFNIEEQKEIHFIIATVGLILASNALESYLQMLSILSNFNEILTSFIIFASSGAVVSALKLIFSHGPALEDEEELQVMNPVSEERWNLTVFVAVCFALVLFILESFFYTNGLTPFFEVLSYLVIIVFIVDAVILYKRSKNMKSFLRYHWADVLAILPLSGMFQLAKLLRFARIIRVFSKTSRIARVSRISHSAKFFSKHSGFNKYMHHKKK